ncbi:hypothetical protein TanjilG_10979 [Lupinus angustifolius]|uniref:Histidine kinase/HSP90-like ATPase domain-containing protein n=1 Tax=Lupinus angustifolius TaxID=3871 RepID=A0A1J7GAQ4_LUPAN|nr:hypothetical protein TanjilG_10979 [Lupinus angustifolius]
MCVGDVMEGRQNRSRSYRNGVMRRSLSSKQKCHDLWILSSTHYSNKDIFLRELISNASNIKLDKEKKILSIRDRGIGMTKEDLIKNMGTIAKLGTSGLYLVLVVLLERIFTVFGVCFYPVYLVSDYVEVISKHNEDKQEVCVGIKDDGEFAISEDTWNEPLRCGTEIRLHLKDEAGEYLEESKLKELVKRYSEFINFPIYIWASKEVDVEVPADDDCNEEDESSESSSLDEETEEDSDKKPLQVIYFTDPVDEYLMQYLMDYEDKKFQNVSKEGLKLGKDAKDKELKESFKDLTKWWKNTLASENVDDVKIFSQLDASKQAYMCSKRVLEINPRHPIINELRERVVKNPEDESVKHTAELIYRTALFESGFLLDNSKDFASRVYDSVKSSLDISPDAAVEEEGKMTLKRSRLKVSRKKSSVPKLKLAMMMSRSCRFFCCLCLGLAL